MRLLEKLFNKIGNTFGKFQCFRSFSFCIGGFHANWVASRNKILIEFFGKGRFKDCLSEKGILLQ